MTPREPMSLEGTLDFLKAAKASFNRDKMLSDKDRQHRCEQADRHIETYTFIDQNRDAFNEARKRRSAT